MKTTKPTKLFIGSDPGHMQKISGEFLTLGDNDIEAEPISETEEFLRAINPGPLDIELKFVDSGFTKAISPEFQRAVKKFRRQKRHEFVTHGKHGARKPR